MPICDRYRGWRYASVAELNNGWDPGWVKVPEDHPAYPGGARWFIRTMVGTIEGTLRDGGHSVAEHPDGTITVDPSLMLFNGWHGWLRGGEFQVITYGVAPRSMPSAHQQSHRPEITEAAIEAHRVCLEVICDPEEMRDFFNGRTESLAEIDWAYHLRMGDLRFVEEATPLPAIHADLREQWEAEFKDGLEDRLPDWLLKEIREGAVADLRERLLSEEAIEAAGRASRTFASADPTAPQTWEATPDSHKRIVREAARIYIGAAIDSIGLNDRPALRGGLVERLRAYASEEDEAGWPAPAQILRDAADRIAAIRRNQADLL